MYERGEQPTACYVAWCGVFSSITQSVLCILLLPRGQSFDRGIHVNGE